MSTPSSGTISIQQINAVFGRGNNLNAYRGTTWFTPQGGSGTFPSGAISMSDFYNKQPNSPTFSFTIGSNQTNANLRTLAVNAGWNQSSQVVATIASGVYLSSNSTGVPGLTVNGSFPGGVRLVNNGFIIGMGGSGGGGASVNPSVLPRGTAAGAGASGGLALSVSVGLTLTNNGTIGGGGGGGGGGGSRWNATSSGYDNFLYGGGGGGGGGGRANAFNSSAGGGGGASGATFNSSGSTGGQGTSGGGGGGGAGGVTTWATGGSGGSGGGWGASGASGAAGSSGLVAGSLASGGGGGAAISGNGNISYLATGTRLGAIT